MPKSIKAFLQGNHIPNNRFTLGVVGLPLLNFTTMTMPEEELDVVELPDRTFASGGRTKPVEFSGMIPGHHTAEVALMLAWLKLEGVDPVFSTYKKPCTITMYRIDGSIGAVWELDGVFPFKYKASDMDTNSDGDMVTYEFTFKADQIRVVPL